MRDADTSMYLSIYLPVCQSPSFLLPFQIYFGGWGWGGEEAEWRAQGCYSLLLKQPIFKNKKSLRIHVVFGMGAPNITRTIYNGPLCTHYSESRQSHRHASSRSSPSTHKYSDPLSRKGHCYPCGIRVWALGNSGHKDKTANIQNPQKLLGAVWTQDTALYRFMYVTVILIHILSFCPLLPRLRFFPLSWPLG